MKEPDTEAEVPRAAWPESRSPLHATPAASRSTTDADRTAMRFMVLLLYGFASVLRGTVSCAVVYSGRSLPARGNGDQPHGRGGDHREHQPRQRHSCRRQRERRPVELAQLLPSLGGPVPGG